MISSLLKIIAESPHSWQKNVIYGNTYIILYISKYGLAHLGWIAAVSSSMLNIL